MQMQQLSPTCDSCMVDSGKAWTSFLAAIRSRLDLRDFCTSCIDASNARSNVSSEELAKLVLPIGPSDKSIISKKSLLLGNCALWPVIWIRRRLVVADTVATLVEDVDLLLSADTVKVRGGAATTTWDGLQRLHMVADTGANPRLRQAEHRIVC